MSKLKTLSLPIPSLEQQALLAESYQRLREERLRLTAAIHAADARAAALRRALLDAAFTGRLTGRGTDVEVVEELAEVAS